MEERYSDLIVETSEFIAERMLCDLEALFEAGSNLDGLVLELLRAIGLKTMARLFAGLVEPALERVGGPNAPVERRPMVPFKTIFGEIMVESPYVRDRETSESSRPMLELFGIAGRSYSDRVQRALADFGSEESFRKAAARFEEHYGWCVGRTTVLRHTEKTAEEAVEFLEERFADAQSDYDKPLAERPGVGEMLVELDGCEIRTGVLQPAPEPGAKRVRKEEWREVRTGVAKPSGEVDPTYVSAMASYPEICDALFSAACLRGLSENTKVIAVGDGGNGLMEALQATLPNVQFILDVPHLKSHFFETAAALGIEEVLRRPWVNTWMERLAAGEVDQVLDELRTLQRDTNNDRLRRLIAYLERFRDAVTYDHFEAQGWPCGSGEVEAAHRVVPQPRLKIVGACWHPDNVNKMLALRVVRANRWWDDFWAWRAARKRAA